VDLGKVRRSQPGMMVCNPAGVRSISDMFGSKLIAEDEESHVVGHLPVVSTRIPKKWLS
jgi:hypothetical protein